MTNETHKLFDAPWQIWGDGCQVCDIRGTERAYCEDIKDSARFVRLPELYDALKRATEDVCWQCSSVKNIFEHPCRDPHANECYVAQWRELLKKVRDGK